MSSLENYLGNCNIIRAVFNLILPRYTREGEEKIAVFHSTGLDTPAEQTHYSPAYYIISMISL